MTPGEAVPYVQTALFLGFGVFAAWWMVRASRWMVATSKTVAELSTSTTAAVAKLSGSIVDLTCSIASIRDKQTRFDPAELEAKVIALDGRLNEVCDGAMREWLRERRQQLG